VAFVVGDDRRVQQVPVTVGVALNNDRQVTAGLSAGQQVVSNPPPELRDGSAVVEKQAQ